MFSSYYNIFFNYMKKTVVLMGGLGNVLYQINLANVLVKEGFEVKLNTFLLSNSFVTNLLGWKTYDINDYKIDFFNYYNLKTENKFSLNLVFSYFNLKIINNLFHCKFFGHDFPRKDELLNCNFFFGYFQKTQYITQEIKESFEKKFKAEISFSLKTKLIDDTIALIHFRGGDKSKDEVFSTSYKKIIENNIYSGFIIVTDDIENAKFYFRNFKKKFYYISSKNMLLDFKIIQTAKIKYLARSSFSWWAAELSDSKCEIYQPKPFYKHVNWNPHSEINRYEYET